MKNELRGIIPPVITIFDDDGKVDEKRYRKLIDFLCDHVQGLFVCGTYGSGPLMTLEERKRTLEIAIDQADGRVPVVAHVGSSVPEHILELANHAEKTGAKAVASVPPFYFGYSQENIIDFFKWFVKEVDIPVYLYNNPKTTGLEIKIETLKELHKNRLAGVKDSTFDLVYFYEVKNNIGLDNFSYISGTEAFIIPSIPLGADAAICGLANALPEIVVELYSKAKSKDYEEAYVLQEKVNHLREIQHYAQSIPAIHAMLNMRGIDSGQAKLPFRLVSESKYSEIKNALQKTGYVDFE
ncbi:MAG: dihydrodipicolinate synthase family protein [Kosmotogaceae bacterium]